MEAEAARLDTEPPYDVSTLDGDASGLPLVIRPAGDPSLARLCGWLEANAAWVQERITQHGAILFRGFAVGSADDFERLARARSTTT